MKDILTDENDEIIIRNGDFAVGRSNEQHQKHIIVANKGEFKEHPELGVGIVEMLSEDDYTPMLIEIKKQLQHDGMQIDNVSINELGKLIVEGKYLEDE